MKNWDAWVAVELARDEQRQQRRFYKAHGRHAQSATELNAWLDAEEAKREAVAGEYREQREREEREARVQALERQAAIDARLVSRASEPEGYSAHQSPEALISAVHAGDSFAERTVLQGKKDSPLHITADLENVNLSHSTFEWVHFADGCNLRNVDFRHSTFKFVIFEQGCSLSEANFDNATFHTTAFDPESAYDGARFRFADFYETNSIEFDGNYLSNATFHKGRRDKWARLSSVYTGIWQFINVALSAAFFGGLLVKLYIFEGVSRIQAIIMSRASPKGTEDLNLSELTSWSFLFGDRPSSIALFLLFLVYQALRLFVTTRVGPMIDMERQTGYTPRRVAYEYLTLLNSLVVILGYIVLSVLVWDIIGILRLTVLIPAV